MTNDGEKQINPRALSRSVVEVAPAPAEGASTPATSLETSLLWFVAQAADEISPWGLSSNLRDRQLRAFFPTESYFLSALGTVCSRNMAFSWTLDGPPRTTKLMQDVLDNADNSEGWHDLMSKVSIDLYTQDKGAFIEVVREADSETAPLLALNHLDASRCQHTGNPEVPVIYRDRKGIYHNLPWYNVVTLAEMPMPLEDRPGLQVCALSRMLRAAQIIRNIIIYREEKTGGRFTRAIHLVKGVTTQQINDALAQARAQADAKGLLRFVMPTLVGTVDPKAEIDFKTIEMATLPENFDEKSALEVYIVIVAMAFLSDYQDFAPLPGGGLGTSNQSQMLHQKSKGRGPALFRKIVTHALNFKILPKNVTFEYEEQDIEAEEKEATVKKLRAEGRAVMVTSGELTPEASRQIALDAGDIPQEVFDKLGSTDVTPHVTAEDEAKPEEPEPGVAWPEYPPALIPGAKHLIGEHPQQFHGRGGMGRVTPAAQATATEVAAEIRGAGVEHLVGVAPDGSIAFRMKGSRDHVGSISDSELPHALGVSILVHNHPGSAPLGKADIVAASYFKVGEIQAVGRKANWKAHPSGAVWLPPRLLAMNKNGPKMGQDRDWGSVMEKF